MEELTDILVGLEQRISAYKNRLQEPKRNVVVWTTKSPRLRNTWSWQKRCIASKPTKPSSPVSPVNSIPTKKVLVSDRIRMSPTSRGKSSGAEQVFREKRVGSCVRNAPRGESLDARKGACAAIGRGGAPDQGEDAADICGHILEAGQAVQEVGPNTFEALEESLIHVV